MCYRQFFDTFGDSIQKCIKSVLLQGIVVQIRMGSGGGLEGGGLRTPVPRSAREPPPGLGSGTAISRFPCSRQLVLDRSDRVFIIWSKRIRTFACRYQKPMPYHLAILHTALVWTVERTGREKQGSKNERAGQNLDYQILDTIFLGMESPAFSSLSILLT